MHLRPLILTAAQQRRLEKLAAEAGRTPAQMLRFVLRDGFDQCEDDVQAGRLADAESRRSGSVPHAEVQRRARALIDAARPRKSRKAA